jgi:hypothetical protein
VIDGLIRSLIAFSTDNEDESKILESGKSVVFRTLNQFSPRIP